MAEDLEALRAKFIKVYADLPSALREEIIAVADEKPYTWNSAYFEVKGKKKTGDEILKRLVQIKVL